ncbi:MAG: hypothetical protein IKM07_01630, partial [Clostridia bacterium]|nr:hypothetical protein [Clostridia bacterium]
PADEYRGLDLWMVNDRLEDDMIVHQVREFREKGLYSVVFRTYNGLISDYPGPEFRRKLRLAIETAAECGLKIVLQAGYMPAAFPALPQEYRLHKIVPVSEEQATDDMQILARTEGFVFTDQVSPAAVNLFDEAAVEFYVRTVYDEMWADFADEFGKTIISIWVDEPRFDNKYLLWTPRLAEEFAARYGYSLPESIPALYFDTGDYKKIRYDYYTLLRERMAQCYYSRVRAWCTAHNLQFSGHLMGEEALITQIAQAVAVMPYYRYFDVPGIDMLCNCHDWYDRPIVPDNRQDRAKVEHSMHVSAIQCVSAAEQTGKAHALCEMYGVTSTNLSFRDLMHLYDFFAAIGINHQCMHALFYSPRGFRKRFYPQAFNVYQPFWENLRNVKDYAARVGCFISTGECARDILILHPLETAYGLIRGLTAPLDIAPREAARDYDNRWYAMLLMLYGSRIPFHFGDQMSIDELGDVRADRFVIGKMGYRIVVVPEIETLSERTFSLLCAFAEAGGRVFFKGAIPSRLDGREDAAMQKTLRALPGARFFETGEDLMRALRDESRREYEYLCDDDASRTIINHRVDGAEHFFMIHNGDCRRGRKGTLKLPGTHRAYSFDAQTGAIREIDAWAADGFTMIPVQTPVGGSSLLFTQPTAQLLSDRPAAAVTRTVPLENVVCRVCGDNLLTLEYCSWRKPDMADFSDTEMPVERVVEKFRREEYEGPITLRFRFWSDFEPKGLKLILEDPEECRVTLNGVPVDTTVLDHYYARAFCVIALPDAVRQGENFLEISRYTKPQLATPPSDNMTHLFELFRSPVGVDMERVHLMGDFCVDAVTETTAGAGLVRMAKRFYLTPPEPVRAVSDLTVHGYPFYPGPVEYTLEADVTEEMLRARDIALEIGRYNACSCTVWVDGEQAGFIDREPYSLSLHGLLQAGRNTIRVRLLGTLRNMIGLSHVEGVDTTGSSRAKWVMEMENAAYTEYDTGRITPSFQQTPLGLGDFSLVITE